MLQRSMLVVHHSIGNNYTTGMPIHSLITIFCQIANMLLVGVKVLVTVVIITYCIVTVSD